MTKNSFRVEKDSLGVQKIPSNALFGAYTQRFNKIFNVSNRNFPLDLRNSIVLIKIAAAETNFELGLLDNKKAKAIVKAGGEILKGKHDSDFKIDVFQAGAGTPYNMNTNEILSNVASNLFGKKNGSKFVHPNDDCNMSQSSNDVIPTATRIAVLLVVKNLLEELKDFEKTLLKKEKEFAKVLKSSRTHLQDAVPTTLGQNFNAFFEMIKKDRQRIEFALNDVKILPIGGTAAGTGINSHSKYSKLVVKKLSKLTGLKLVCSKNPMAEMQNHSDLTMLSNVLTIFAGDLGKIASDLRLLSSGPNTGFNEIILPKVIPGSSIMPAKINPSVPEMVNMVCFQVEGNNQTICNAAFRGELELNVFMPIIALNLLESLSILTNAVKIFSNHCVNGIKANKDVCEKNFFNSAALPTILNPIIGYDLTAEIIKESLKTKKSFIEIVLDKKILTKKEIDLMLKNSTKPNVDFIKKLKK